MEGNYREQKNKYGEPAHDLRESRGIVRRGLYPGHIQEHLRETWDLNARLSWRVRPSLQSVTRIDYQWIPLETTAWTSPDESSPGETMESRTKNFILNQSLTWTPTPWFSGLLHGSFVHSRADSAADAVPVAGGGFNYEVIEAKNDYLSAGLHAFIDLSERASLECAYSYLYADNAFDNSANSVPYGVALEEHYISASYRRLLREGLIWRLTAGAARGDEDSSGNQNDFSSSYIATSFEITF
jgi:hypothetical protein